MKGFDVLKVKSAVKTRNKFDLSRTHLTTMDFGQIVPLFVEETVPGDKFTVSADYFARLAPLVKPTYGKFLFKTVSAFVPYHQVAYDAEAWLAGKTTMEGQTPLHRWFTPGTIHDLVVNYWTISALNYSSADYVYISSGGVKTYRAFTNKGKFYVKILNALGYALPENVDLTTGSSWLNSVKDMHLSAYPLLAFLKLYNDYMSQSQRFNTSTLSASLFNIKNNRSMTGYNVSTGELSIQALYPLFGFIQLNYENDYFTSAWQNPNNAIGTVESVNQIPSTSMPSSELASMPLSTIYSNYEVLDTNLRLSQRALDWLKAFDDWVRRNNYSGSRAVQQIYSRFGIKPDDFRAHYAHVIDTKAVPIQIGDVTATAGFIDQNSEDVALGDYAGKGIVNGGNTISYAADDFGMLFIFGYFTVVPMMSFGYDRRVLRSTPTDYYNPEFDGLGAEAISAGEVFTSPVAVENADSSADNQVYGYTERYNSYRYGRDVITGEFRDYKFGDMSVWHSGRNLTDIRRNLNMVAQSTSMNTLDQSDSEYNRIFADNSGDEDHFYLTANFKVDAIRPMLNLNQVPQLGEGDTNVPRNGNVIS